MFEIINRVSSRGRVYAMVVCDEASEESGRCVDVAINAEHGVVIAFASDHHDPDRAHLECTQ